MKDYHINIFQSDEDGGHIADRVFYDVAGAEVQNLTIVTKEQAEAWLRKSGVP